MGLSMKLVRHLWHFLLQKYRRSQYAKPLIAFVLFLVICALLAVLFETRSNGEFESILDGFWWVIITFSTTGYGDKVPITVGGRVIAILAILVGVASMSLLSGGLASWLIDRNTRARRGLVDYSKMKGHYIICGWKQDMREILHDIVNSAEEMAHKIVLISNVDADSLEQIREDDALRDIKFVRGDYFAISSLKRGGVAWAKKVIVLADTVESSASTEIDSRTVLTALTIKSIAREVYVVAELLDKKFASYLHYINCDEILFSRDVARRMLVNASIVDGMSHIMYQLFAQDKQGARLEIIAIPEQFVGRPYGDFRRQVGDLDNQRRLILGLVENNGNPARLKIESLREAQKTSDVSQLVTNLQKVKGIEINKPILFPEDEYTIASNSRAVMLVRARVTTPATQPAVGAA